MITLKDKVVLLTGASGWLGLNLLEELKAIRGTGQEFHLRCLLLPEQPSQAVTAIFPEAEIVIGNIVNAEDCERFCRDAPAGLLLHTAGIIHPRKVSEFYDINLAGTRNLLQAAINAKLKRAVIVSSNSPCGCNPHPDHLFDEASPYNPYMNYGRSKMEMELAVRAAQKTGAIETVLIRAPWFYGPHQPARQTLFFEMIRDGKAPIVGTGRNLRSMANTQKLAEALLLAATTPAAAGQLYWIADERPYSMIEIIDTLERLMETEFNQVCQHKRMRLPGIVSEVAYVLDKMLQSVGLYHQKIHVLSEMNKTIACSVEKAKRELGYEPAKNLDDGMRASMRIAFGAKTS